jgi:hypothetical protein
MVSEDSDQVVSGFLPVRYLEAGLVALPIRPVWLPDEPDREASFSVYKTDDPTTLLDQPFLLIVRTRHVVTMVNAPSDATMSSAGYSEFPAYGQMRTVLLPARGAAMYLRTVRDCYYSKTGGLGAAGTFLADSHSRL